MNEKRVIIDYTNWRGERAVRIIEPITFYWGKNEFHPEPQWLLEAIDYDKKERRVFAMKCIHEWRAK